MTDWKQEAVEGSISIDGFEFADRRRLDVELGYRTLGDLSRARDNAVLLLHGTTATGAQYLEPSFADPLFAVGAPLDVSRHFVILPDAIGHGASTKPSDGLGPDFPSYGYTDMVRGLHELVEKKFGIRRLRLVLGTSMGGMQTWMWGERYPESACALMAVASLPERVSGRNLLWRRMVIDLVRGDPGYRGGLYGRQPAGLGPAMAIFSMMTSSAQRLGAEVPSIEDAERLLADARTESSGQDANDLIWEFASSYDYDPAPELESIAAPFWAVNFEDDALNPLELGVLEPAISRLPRGRAVIVPAGPESRGHMTLMVAKVWGEHVGELLAQTEET